MLDCSVWSYSMFPVLLVVLLVVLYVGPYRHLGDVNRIFAAGKRPVSLSAMLSGYIVLLIVLFLAMQPVRLPLLIELASVAIHGQITEIDFPQCVILVALIAGIIAELVMLIHQIYYLRTCQSGASQSPPLVLPAVPERPPAVAVLIPACDEPKEIIARSLSSAERMVYANKRVILVENSRDPERKKDALQVARQFAVEVFDIPNRGTKAGALNDARALLGIEIKYLFVLDADQRVELDALTALVPLLEKDERLALVQTAQTYENCCDSLLTCAASQQQMLLYDCVMEGKAAKECAPCYGTNCLLRVSALDEVGGWDESNVTEDLATSYRLQVYGWKSTYLRTVYAKGLAPASLEAYWRQQLRWSTGNTMLAFSLIGEFIRCKSSASLNIRGSYLWSAGFSFVTLIIQILASTPTVVLVLGLVNGIKGFFPPSTSDHLKWAALSLYPIYVSSLLFPYFHMAMRGYPVRNMVLTQGLAVTTGSIYMRGIRQALWGGSNLFLGTSGHKPNWPDRRARSLLFTPQAIGFFMLNAGGSFCLSKAFEHPADPIPWILVAWFYISGLSLGHFFLIRFDEARRAA